MRYVAHLFPGQGSQRIGMGGDLLARYPDLLAPLYRRADEITGTDLTRVCLEGPAEQLRRTDITQPAVFVTSVATAMVLATSLPPPQAVAGHSLGEYAALVSAGVLEVEDALRLVHRRGRLMARVDELTPGAMLAVMGATPDAVRSWCERAADEVGEVVEVANDNEPSQTVVSGTRAGVAAVRTLAQADGGPELRLVPLDVGAPFHCSLMAPIEAEFAAALDEVAFRDPQRTIVSTVTAAVVRTGEEARAALAAQLSGRVRWREAMDTLTALGAQTFVEVGPGRVLTGIASRIRPDAQVWSASDARRLDRTVAALATAVA